MSEAELPGLVERGSEVRRLLEEYKASERHVSEIMAVAMSSSRYRRRRDNSQLQERLRELAREHLRFGYRRLHFYLHGEMGVNHMPESAAKWAPLRSRLHTAALRPKGTPSRNKTRKLYAMISYTELDEKGGHASSLRHSKPRLSQFRHPASQ